MGNYCEAAKIMNDIIRLAPEDSMYYKRGLLYYWCGNLEAASQDYMKALDLTHDHNDSAKYYISLGLAQGSKLIKAKGFYRKAVAIEPNSGGYLYLGDLAFARKKYKEAIVNYSEQIAQHQDSTALTYWPFLGRGTSRFYLKDYTGAVEDLDTAIRFEPSCRSCQLIKARVKKKMGLKVQACEDYKLAQAWGYTEFNELIELYCKED